MSGLFSADAWRTVWTYRATFLHGLGNTVELAVVALLLSLVLGMLFGLLSTSGKKPLAALARIYVELIQNTPLLLQMCFLYYLLAFSGNSIGILPTGMIALGVYHGAYMSEVIRAGHPGRSQRPVGGRPGPGLRLPGPDVLHHPAPEHQDDPAPHGQPGGQPHQKYLLSVHCGRRRPDLGDLQLWSPAPTPAAPTRPLTSSAACCSSPSASPCPPWPASGKPL